MPKMYAVFAQYRGEEGEGYPSWLSTHGGLTEVVTSRRLFSHLKDVKDMIQYMKKDDKMRGIKGWHYEAVPVEIGHKAGKNVQKRS